MREFKISPKLYQLIMYRLSVESMTIDEILQYGTTLGYTYEVDHNSLRNKYQLDVTDFYNCIVFCHYMYNDYNTSKKVLE